MDSSNDVASRVKILTESLGTLPEPVAHPALIILSGLPGTGKSYFSHRLVEKTPAVILESDALRKQLFPNPTYSPRESGLLFETLHVVIERLLKQNYSVILDATNLSERHRETLYHIAERCNVRLVIVYLEAPSELVGERLEKRRSEVGNVSDADWSVYQRMRGAVEEIKRRHYTINTAGDITPAINQIVADITK